MRWLRYSPFPNGGGGSSLPGVRSLLQPAPTVIANATPVSPPANTEAAGVTVIGMSANLAVAAGTLLFAELMFTSWSCTVTTAVWFLTLWDDVSSTPIGRPWDSRAWTTSANGGVCVRSVQFDPNVVIAGYTGQLKLSIRAHSGTASTLTLLAGNGGSNNALPMELDLFSVNV